MCREVNYIILLFHGNGKNKIAFRRLFEKQRLRECCKCGGVFGKIRQKRLREKGENLLVGIRKK